MGVWKKIAGWGLIGSGAALAPFTGGASLAAIPAGANILGADQKAEGSEKAASQQQAAIQQGIKTQEQARDAMQQAYAPYTTIGGQGMEALGDYMGLPGLGALAGPQTPWGTGMGTGVNLTPLPGQGVKAPGFRVPSDDAELTSRQPVPRDAAGSAVPQARASFQTQTGYTPTLGNTGGLVRMRAPTGEVKWVPREQASHYAQRGATIEA